MALRQETTQNRNYASPGTKRIVPKFRAVPEGSRLPDYDRLPDFSLIDAAEARLLTGMSQTTMDKLLRSGEFPKPRRHGRNRVWSLGAVRQWCEQVAQTPEREGAD